MQSESPSYKTQIRFISLSQQQRPFASGILFNNAYQEKVPKRKINFYYSVYKTYSSNFYFLDIDVYCYRFIYYSHSSNFRRLYIL